MHKAVYESRISDGSSYVCPSDLGEETVLLVGGDDAFGQHPELRHVIGPRPGPRAERVRVGDGDLVLDHMPVVQHDRHLAAERLHRRVARMIAARPLRILDRSEEHTSELQSLMRISYAVFCLKKKNTYTNNNPEY